MKIIRYWRYQYPLSRLLKKMILNGCGKIFGIKSNAKIKSKLSGKRLPTQKRKIITIRKKCNDLVSMEYFENFFERNVDLENFLPE